MASIVDSLRQPEYTGENRCIPCTLANSVIAVVLAVGLAAVLVFGSVTGPTLAGAAALAVLAVSAGAIYLRGYLVPKTPELTKRYFPDWFLAYFDKGPEPGVGLHPPGAGTESGTGTETGSGTEHDEGGEGEGADEGGIGEPGASEVDPERALFEAGAVEGCIEEDDLCLTDSFAADWGARMDRVNDGDVSTDDIVAALGIGDELGEEATLVGFGDAVVLEDAGREVGKWESQAALVADVAAAGVLAERYAEWTGLNAYDRSRLLRGLRIFVEECPLCGGPMALDQDTVESCCRSYDVVAVTCDECEARLFEEQWDESAVEAGAD